MIISKISIIDKSDIYSWLIVKTATLNIKTFEELEEYAYDIGDDQESDEILFYLASYHAYENSLKQLDKDQ